MTKHHTVYYCDECLDPLEIGEELIVILTPLGFPVKSQSNESTVNALLYHRYCAPIRFATLEA